MTLKDTFLQKSCNLQQLNYGSQQQRPPRSAQSPQDLPACERCGVRCQVPWPETLSTAEYIFECTSHIWNFSVEATACDWIIAVMVDRLGGQIWVLNLGKMYRQIKPPNRGALLHEDGLGSGPSPVIISSLSGRFWGTLSQQSYLLLVRENQEFNPSQVHIAILKLIILVLFLLPWHLPLLEPKLERTTVHSRAQAQGSAVQTCSRSKPGQIPVAESSPTIIAMTFDTRLWF